MILPHVGLSRMRSVKGCSHSHWQSSAELLWISGPWRCPLGLLRQLCGGGSKQPGKRNKPQCCETILLCMHAGKVSHIKDYCKVFIFNWKFGSRGRSILWLNSTTVSWEKDIKWHFLWNFWENRTEDRVGLVYFTTRVWTFLYLLQQYCWAIQCRSRTYLDKVLWVR